jgi:eukaryotic-like serine/threonine-protein kinase
MIAAESAMQLGEGSLFALAEAIADGNQIDWDLAESSAGDSRQRLVVEQLRRLAAMSAAARAHSPTWGPFPIRGEIGGGTFGGVFRAWDPRLEREVALKVLHRAHDAASEAAVIGEARLLAKVQHPNIVTVYGADVVDGQVGIWMELIDGRTLTDILRSDGPFGAHEAALVGRDVCRALAAVHRQDCVHRDVKAQNVMRQAGGRIVLMDFGAGGAAAEAGAKLAGTPAYLAPEVMAGGTHSRQSDIYSVGVLLYHLVSGRFPVVGASLEDLRGEHARGEAVPLRDVRPDLPEAFIRVVERATAPNPALRPRSAGALEELLNDALSGDRASPASAPVPGQRSQRWHLAVALGVLLTVVAGVVAGLKWTSDVPAVAAATRSSVAILPFRNLTTGANGDYLGDGITDDLAAHLGRLRNLRVISGASTRRFRDRSKTEIEIGSALGVAAVLDGSIRHDGDRVRIVTRLVDATTGEQLWSESFETENASLFTTQSAVARQIAVALLGQLSAPEAELVAGVRQKDYEAFKLYSQGRYHLALRTPQDLNKALVFFQQAIARDAQYGLAFAGLADTYTQLGIYEVLPRASANARALEAATTAVRLAPQAAEAHAALAYVLKNRFAWSAAEASYRRAIALRPSYSTAHHYYSIFLTQHGRFAEAMTEIRTALALDPLSVGPQFQLGSLLVMSRRYDEALRQYDSLRQVDPGNPRVYRFMAAPLIFQRRFEEAEAALTQASRLSPIGAEDQELKQDLGYLFAAAGRTADAHGVIADLKRRVEGAGEPLAGSIAAIYTGLGDHDQALHWLERAFTVGDLELGYAHADPRWDPLKPDPRFQALLARLGFSPRKT